MPESQPLTRPRTVNTRSALLDVLMHHGCVMFAANRPVPSKAALRVLRQLAYISSGTACGAAAVVAEERRRRLRLASTIADNARKLKQHPRYAHTAAAVVNQEQEYPPLDSYYLASHADGEEEYMAIDGSGKAGGRTLWASSEPCDTLRSDSLPSQVDGGYAKLRARDTAREPSLSKEEQRKSAKRLHNGRTQRDQPVKGPASMIKPPLSRMTVPSTSQTPKRPKAITLEPTHVCDGATVAYKMFRDLVNLHANGPETLTASTTDIHAEASRRPEAAEIASAVESFLRLQPSENAEFSGEPTHLARGLLQLAAGAHLLDECRSLSQQLQKLKSYTAEHFEMLRNKFLPLRPEHGIEQVEDLYLNILLRKDLEGLDPDYLSRCRLRLTLDLLGANPESATQYGTCRRKLAPLVVSIMRAQGIERALIHLQDLCQELRASGEYRKASDLFMHTVGSDGRFQIDNSVSEIRTKLAQDLLDACIEAGALEEAMAILTFIDKRNPSTFGSVQFNKVMHLAIDQGNDKTLLAAFDRATMRGHSVVPALHIRLLKVLAEQKPATAAAWLVQNIRHPERPEMLRTCQLAWPALLRCIWSLTRDFKMAARAFYNMCDISGNENVDSKVYNAMVGVYVRAGHNDKAQKILRQMQQDDNLRPGIETFGHLLLSAARVEKWSTVDSLVDVLAESGSAAVTGEGRTHALSPMLHEFALHHQPEEVWKFTAGLIDRGIVRPTQATLNIVLESFVRGRSVAYLPHWLRYMRVSNFEVHINAATAAKLIKRYYYDFRPSHEVLLWLVRNLSHLAKNLMSEDLMFLARDAIGYDIRHYEGKNERTFREAAQWRLERLDHAFDEIPSPRPLARGQHNHSDSDASVRSPSSVSTSSVAEEKASPLADLPGLSLTPGLLPLAESSIAAFQEQESSGSFPNARAEPSITKQSVTKNALAPRQSLMQTSEPSHTDFETPINTATQLDPSKPETVVDLPQHNTLGHVHPVDNLSLPSSRPLIRRKAVNRAHSRSIPFAARSTAGPEADLCPERTEHGPSDDAQVVSWPQSLSIDAETSKVARNRKHIVSLTHSFGPNSPGREFQEDSCNLHVQEKTSAQQMWREKLKAKSEMLVALTMGRPQDAVEMYRNTLSASGIPLSSVSLDIAVEASLRARNGSHEEATRLLKDAESAGINVTPSLSPLLINQFRQQALRADNEMGGLREVVSNFYKELDNNAIPVSHHVAVTAAHVLIQSRRPGHAVSLLRDIFHSTWAAQRPLDHVAMTVFLQGYTALVHADGIEWVLREMTEQDLRVDHRFLAVLKLTQKKVVQHAQRGANARLVDLAADLENWTTLLKAQQRAQIQAAGRMGRQLVQALAGSAQALDHDGPGPNKPPALEPPSPDAIQRRRKRRLASMHRAPFCARLLHGFTDDEDRALAFRYTRPAPASDRALDRTRDLDRNRASMRARRRALSEVHCHDGTVS